MGIAASRDTRRISFDNNFALSNSALDVPKAIKDDIIIGFEELTPETAGELIFTDKTKYTEIPEEGETDYWLQRIDNLKKEHQSINKIVETEYDKQIQTTNNMYEIPKITHERMAKIKPCFDWRTKILQCYEENPHQPLMCSSYVQMFTKCVASCRGNQ